MPVVFKQLPDEAMLSEINIPGTHDSCTAYCTLENVSRCQKLTVKEQLELGVRLFDIRLSKNGDDFYLVHALADCFTDEDKKTKLSFDMVLSEFRAFLAENPEETLIVSIKQDRGIVNRWFFPPFYKKYIDGNEKEWYLKNENPLLSECRGKMVLMRRCRVWRSFKKERETGLDFSYWRDQNSKRKTHPYPVYLNKKTVAMVQDRYGLCAERKWNDCIRDFLECSADVIEQKQLAVHFLSTANRQNEKTLVPVAEKINSEFMKYKLNGEKAQGWMLFDFPTQELVDKIITSNCEIYKEKIK